jgi:site-specific DNA-methyltransferase (adenine-specific)
MGKRWDYDVPSVEVWAECLRVLKPGGHLLAFAGTRTQHRMTVRIEDAGFEIRDMIAWVYGSGFPKSLNVAKAIESGGGRPEDIRRMQQGKAYVPSGRGRVNYDHGAASAMDAGATQWEPATDAARQWQGWGTALKPALEPITVARKPLAGTVAENVLAHGTGALNIDGCRVEGVVTSNPKARGAGNISTSGHKGQDDTGLDRVSDIGRWPANLIHDGSDEVLAAFPQAPGQMAKAAEGGDRRKDQNVYGAMTRGPSGAEPRADTGSAARFFYCAKASKADRNEGLDGFKARAEPAHRRTNIEATGDNPYLRGATERLNPHPTVKPTDLMRYLCRLITPPGGLVLDPFMGSGSTGKAAVLEGFRFIGIEQDADYWAVAQARIKGAKP